MSPRNSAPRKSIRIVGESVGKPHILLDGKVRLFKRSFSQFYIATAKLGVGLWKTYSTKSTELNEAKDIAREKFFDLLRKQKEGEPLDDTSFKKVVLKMFKHQEHRFDLGQIKNKTHLETYKVKVKVLTKFFWDMNKKNIGDITTNDIMAYHSWRRDNVMKGDRRYLKDEPITDKTIHGDFSALRQTFKLALRENLINRIPEFPKLKYDKNRHRAWFTPPEYKALLKSADENIIRAGKDQRLKRYAEDLKDWILWGCHTGMRVNESLSIKVGQVEIHNEAQLEKGKAYCYIHILENQSKTGERIAIGMVGAVRAFKRMVERYNKKPHDLLFPENPRWRFTKLLKETSGVNTKSLRYDLAGRKRDSVSLRHNFIMFRLLYGKLDPFTIARICGNSVVTIENHYARHLTAQMKKREILHYEKLDNDIDWSNEFIQGLRNQQPV